MAAPPAGMTDLLAGGPGDDLMDHMASYVSPAWRPEPAASPVHVFAYGIAIRHRPLIVRHPVIETWLLIHFHDPVLIDGHRTDGPALMIWAPGQARSYGDPLQCWRHDWMHLGGEAIAALLATSGLTTGRPRPVPAGSRGVAHLWALHEELRHPHSEVQIQRNLIQNWLLCLLREPPTQPSPGVQRVLERLDDTADRPWSLSAMAALAGMSLSHFRTVFTRETGQAPGRYLQQLRIDRARILLAVHGCSVQECAERLGYADAFSFSRAFKRVVGSSPQHWRSHSA